jgi:protein arginine N-methyltransferase 3
MSDDGSSSSDDNDLPELVEGTSKLKLSDEDREFPDEDKFIDSLKSALDLFSKSSFRTAEQCIDHCRDVHGMDLNVLKKRHNMDTFSYIRLINFIRTESPSAGFVMSLSSDNTWQNDKYMKPVIEDDPLLMYNFDEDDNFDDEDENGFGIDISRDLNDQIENPRRKLMNENMEEAVGRVRRELEHEMNSLHKQLQEKEAELAECREDMIKMRTAAQSLFSGMEESKRSEGEGKGGDVVSVSDQKTVEEDYSYFKSYAHYSIHLDMLSDKVRTESYRDALLNNSSSISGQRVLDIGCGTGILSMFAAKAGASAVVGVDCSDIIYQAMDIIQENGLSDQIKLVKGRLEETKLPYDSFQFIVSEWMGYFLLFEGMLDSVLEARDKYLAPGGTMVPNRTTISLVGVEDEKRYGELLDFWDDVYGYKMKCMRAPILAEANVEVVPSSSVISDPALVLDLDLNTCTVEDTQFNTPFTLNITRDCNLTAIVGYFDTYFNLSSPVMFSTGPQATPTHWRQTVFYLPAKLAVKAGQQLACNILCKRMKSDSRALKVALTVEGAVYKYTVD